MCWNTLKGSSGVFREKYWAMALCHIFQNHIIKFSHPSPGLHQPYLACSISKLIWESPTIFQGHQRPLKVISGLGLRQRILGNQKIYTRVMSLKCRADLTMKSLLFTMPEKYVLSPENPCFEAKWGGARDRFLTPYAPEIFSVACSLHKSAIQLELKWLVPGLQTYMHKLHIIITKPITEQKLIIVNLWLQTYCQPKWCHFLLDFFD